MRAGRLLIQLTAYYLVIALVIVIALKVWPDLRAHLAAGQEPAPGERSDPRRARRQFR
jgi:hypothetical protein